MENLRKLKIVERLALSENHGEQYSVALTLSNI